MNTTDTLLKAIKSQSGEQLSLTLILSRRITREQLRKNLSLAVTGCTRLVGMVGNQSCQSISFFYECEDDSSLPSFLLELKLGRLMNDFCIKLDFLHLEYVCANEVGRIRNN